MSATPPVNMDKQGKYVRGHRHFDPSKSIWAAGVDHVHITQEAWMKGTPVPGQSQARCYDVGFPVGENGEGWVKVHMAPSTQSIHGHPMTGPSSPVQASKGGTNS